MTVIRRTRKPIPTSATPQPVKTSLAAVRGQPAGATFERALGVVSTWKPSLRQSAVTAFETCPRQFMFSCVYGIRPTGRSAAADAGSFAHATVAALAMNGGSVSGAAETLKTLITAVDRSMRDTNQYTDETDYAKMVQSSSVGFATGLRIYNMLYQAFLEVPACQVRAVELTLPAEPGPDGILYEGTVDMVLYIPCTKAGCGDGSRPGSTGTWVIWDTKTTGKSPREVAELINLRLQPRIYAAGLFPGCTVKAMYGIYQVPTIRRKKMGKPNEQTLDDYLAECTEWWDGTGRHKDRKDELRGNPSGQLVTLTIPGADPYLLEPGVTMHDRINAYLTAIDRLGGTNLISDWPCYERSCGMCLYTALCGKGTRDWQTALNSHRFTLAPDPLRAANPAGHHDLDEPAIVLYEPHN